MDDASDELFANDFFSDCLDIMNLDRMTCGAVSRVCKARKQEKAECCTKMGVGAVGARRADVRGLLGSPWKRGWKSVVGKWVLPI